MPKNAYFLKIKRQNRHSIGDSAPSGVARGGDKWGHAPRGASLGCAPARALAEKFPGRATEKKTEKQQ